MCFEHDIAWNIFLTTIETKEVVRIAGYSIRAASFFLIVEYLILKTISLEQLTTERQGYKFQTVYTILENNHQCVPFGLFITNILLLLLIFFIISRFGIYFE
jgi:large-conductance mechanosensitive channel